MKSMFDKLQGLGQKAVQIKQAIEGAPAKVATMREAMHQTAGSLALTAGQLQLARSELQQVATGLHVENDNDFTEAFREIAENHLIFREAGYDLTGIDMEVSHGQRLIVHLHRLAAVPEHTLRYILTQNNTKVTLSSILSSIINAEKLAANVNTPGLEYTGLIVHLGPVPAVRISWREVHQVAAIATTPTISMPAPKSAATLPATSNFTQSNFFDRPASTPLPANAAPSTEPMEIAATLPPSRPTFSSAKSLKGDWKKEALERLKSSPGESKYRR